MIGEIDLHGVFVAPLLVWMVAAFAASAMLRRFLGWTGLYRLVWHRALFDSSLYVVVLGAVVALSSHWTRT